MVSILRSCELSLLWSPVGDRLKLNITRGRKILRILLRSFHRIIAFPSRRSTATTYRGS